ncbi:MAG: hypothetical protein V5A72_01980 [Candidatus Nanohaloarchaea archaeon]
MEEGETFTWKSDGSTYLNYPFLVGVEESEVETSWEQSGQKWVEREELANFDFIQEKEFIEKLNQV